MRGCFQIYTGDGKGKTTAALGLTLRAAGAGLRVYIGQFIKAGAYSEIKALRARFPEVTVDQYGPARFVRSTPSPREIRQAKEGLRKLREALGGGRYDVVIGDEAVTAVGAGLLDTDELIALAGDRPPAVELVLTGRGAPRRLIARADLVTRMQGVKHYLDRGVKARKGIEF